VNNKILKLFFIALLLTPSGAIAATYSDSDVPLILPRSSWENNSALVNLLDWLPENKSEESLSDENPNSNDTIPDYAPVDRIVIHDTGCSSKTSWCNKDNVDSKEIISAIYRNHAKQRGWGDIGYHYIIDRQGNIYEARFGGNGVRGAHVYDSKNCTNFNVGTIGISILGNYENTQVPKSAFDSLSKLVGWLSAANGINPSETNKTTLQWANPKRNGRCDTNYGHFSKNFTGPTILGHNDIEPANTDPGRLNIPLLRQNAKKWSDKYSQYTYRADGENFKLSSGLKIQTTKATNTIKISNTQAGLFPNASQVDLPEGTLIRARSRPDIFIIENKKRRHIASYAIFKSKKYSLSNVKTLGDRELIGYPLGNPILFNNGTLLVSESTKKTYLIENRTKKYIIAPWAFQKNKLNAKDIIKVSEEELKNYADGGIIGLPEGSILTDKKRRDFYIVSDGGKKKIKNWNIFLASKFNKRPEHKLSQKDLAQYPNKGLIAYANGTLVRQENNPKVYILTDGKAKWIKTYAEFKKLGRSMKDVLSLSAQDLTSYALGIQTASAATKNNTTVTTKITKPTAKISKKENIQKIRVAIKSYKKSDAIKITANGKFYLINKNTKRILYNPEKVIDIIWANTGNVKLEPVNKDTIFEVLNYKNYNWNKTVNFNKFRGDLEIVYSEKSKKVFLINELPFEKYLYGIGEALDSDEPEYQKAFAISARSYAMFHLKNGGKYGKDEVYNLNNTPSDQVYQGYNWETYAPRLVAAVKATEGIVMEYNGKIARSVYSSDSGGTTKNACKFWRGVFCSSDYGYLSGGIKDPAGTVRRSAEIIKKSHGVGMSATGARKLARLGKNYEQILKYYYKGIMLEKLSEKNQ
jgi:peptidoglycan hydrolase-like amidase